MKTSDIQVTLLDSMGSDLTVVNAARVSFDKQSSYEESSDGYSWVIKDQDKKLISYLAQHKHTSPFNHCFASFRVKAPIFVARQLVKHKFMPWNEVSRRYVDSEPEFYFPDYWRAASANVKQGSSECPVTHLSVPEDGTDAFYPVMDFVYPQTHRCLKLYNQLLGDGVCPEQARMVLPQNTMTEWIWSGTLGAIEDMCRLRLDSHTQYETRLVAQKIAGEMEKLYPVSWKALLQETK